MPIPYSKKIQLNEEHKIVVRLNKKTFSYIEAKPSFELQSARNCMIIGHCTVAEFTEPRIVKVSSMMVLINVDNNPFYINCDETGFNLVGANFLQYNNCTGSVGNSSFSNRIFECTQTLSFSLHKNKFATEKPLIFWDMVLQHQTNLQTIEGLRYHNCVYIARNYSTSSSHKIR